MANKRKFRTFPERLYGSNILSDGALQPILPSEVIIAKIQKHSKITL